MLNRVRDFIKRDLPKVVNIIFEKGLIGELKHYPKLKVQCYFQNPYALFVPYSLLMILNRLSPIDRV